MRGITAVAAKELRHGLRNRWVVAATALLAALALGLALLGSAPTGTVGVAPLLVTVVSLASLSIFLIPLIALLLSHDALVGELERGTLLLVLTYPIGRWEILLGKFAGHLTILAVATLAGYGIAGMALGALGDGAAPWAPFGLLLGSSVLLGAVFLALGYLASALVTTRATAAGLAVGLWLLFVLLWDLALLGALVADQERRLAADAFPWLLLANPADVYRLLNLTAFPAVRELSGMSGLGAGAGFSAAALLGALFGWVAAPLAAAGLVFSRREL